MPGLRDVSIEDLVKDGAILEIQDGNHGERHPKSTDYVDDGIPFVMANSLTEGIVDLKGASKIPEQLSDTLRIGFARTGDVLLTHKGTIGNTAVVGSIDPYPYIMLTPQVTYYRTDSTKLLNRYLYYAFRDPVFQRTMTSLAAQSTRPYIGITAQRRLRIKVHPRDVQARIVSKITGYDELIENNRRRMQLLEQSARLLYKEWFVHLRFPGHEHVKVVDGVPKGWERLPFEQVCDSIGGGTPSTAASEYWDGDITWVTPSDVTKSGSLYLLDAEKKITEAGLRNSSAKMLPPDAILMTSRASIGFFAIANRSVCTNQGFIAVVPKVEHSRSFLLFHLMSRVEEFRSRASGSTFKELSKGKFRELSVIWPGRSIYGEFEDHTAPILAQIQSLAIMNAKLVQARDLLLPHLMSGEIEV